MINIIADAAPSKITPTRPCCHHHCCIILMILRSCHRHLWCYCYSSAAMSRFCCHVKRPHCYDAAAAIMLPCCHRCNTATPAIMPPPLWYWAVIVTACNILTLTWYRHRCLHWHGTATLLPLQCSFYNTATITAIASVATPLPWYSFHYTSTSITTECRCWYDADIAAMMPRPPL